MNFIYIQKFIWISFQEGWNMPKLKNYFVLHFVFHCQKLLKLYHSTYILLFCIDLSTKLYQDLLFNWTHLPLFQNMSVKIYTNFFNYLEGKMRHGMWVHMLLNNLASFSLRHRPNFLAQDVKMIWKSSKTLS